MLFRSYPVATSDLAAHMVHEHQAGAVNRIAYAQYLARELKGDTTAAAEARMDAEARELARYLLFADEAPLPMPLDGGDRAFREDFVRARRVVAGHSLRDLELRTRLLRHRCSYMIHTAQFDGLEASIRRRVLAWIGRAVADEARPPGLDHLEEGERKVIREILSRTVAGFAG